MTRSYNIDPKTKIDAGEPWHYHFEIEPAVAKKLIAEKDENGGDYGKIINRRLRQSFGIKERKSRSKK